MGSNFEIEATNLSLFRVFPEMTLEQDIKDKTHT